MIDWPIIAPILTLAFGIFIALLNRQLGNEKNESLQWNIVLFIFVASVFQLSVLGTDSWGISGSGLFRLDGITTCYSSIFLINAIFQHINMRFEKNGFEREVALFELTFIFFGTALLLANSLIIQVLCIPMVYMIAATAPQLSVKRSSKGSFDSGALGGIILLAGGVIAAGLIGQGTHGFQLNVAQENLRAAASSREYYLGWWIQNFILLIFILLPPVSLFLERYEKSQSWGINAFFRGSLPLLGTLLLHKWFLLTATSWGDQETLAQGLWIRADVVLGSIGVASLLVVAIALFSTNSVMQLTQYVALLPLILSFGGQLLGTKTDLVLSHQGIIISTLLVAATHYTYNCIKLPTNSKLEDLRDYMKSAPTRIQLTYLIILLLSVPAFNYAGTEVLSTKLSAFVVSNGSSPLSFAMLFLVIICSGILMLRVVELFASNAKRNSIEDQKGVSNKLWGYTLVLLLIVLGVYPTPLYKYLVHSISLFMKSS